MTSKRDFMNPATMAAVLLFAVSTISAPANADDRRASDTDELTSTHIQDVSKEQARQANEAAVEEAAQAVEAAARLDLDIRLIGHTSMIIAGEV